PRRSAASAGRTGSSPATSSSTTSRSRPGCSRSCARCCRNRRPWSGNSDTGALSTGAPTPPLARRTDVCRRTVQVASQDTDTARMNAGTGGFEPGRRKEYNFGPLSRIVRIHAPGHPPHRLRHRRHDRACRASGRGAERQRPGRTRRAGDPHREQAAQAAGPGRAGGGLPRRARRLPAGAAGDRDHPVRDRRGDGRPAGDDRIQPRPRRMRHLRPVRRARQLAPDQRRGRRGPARREPGADARRRSPSTDQSRPPHPRATGQRMNPTGSLMATQLEEITIEAPVADRPLQNEAIHEQLGRRYDAGFVTDIESDSLPPGLDEDTIRALSAKKEEPEWMTQWRLEAYRRWLTMPVPHWAKLRIAPIDFQAISYYSAPKGPKYKSFDEVPQELLDTYDKLGVPLHERAKLAGVAVDAVFDSVSVGTTFRKELAEKGIIFCSMSEAIKDHPELVKRYLGTVVPVADNYFAALNSAVFSDGSFVFIPRGVRCPMELSTYFRINAGHTGQFERTLIICE